jgi:hypothetical protein
MTFREALLCLFILLMPFQDTFLRGTPLRLLGSSFAILPLLILVVLDVVEWLLSSRRNVNLIAAGTASWSVLLTLTYLAMTGPVWNGASLPLKAVNIGIMIALAAWVVFRQDWLSFRYLRPSVHGAFAIVILGVLVNDVNLAGLKPLTANPVLHYLQNPDSRWHGLSPEASMLSMSLGSLGLLSAALAQSSVRRGLCIAITAGMLAASGSKGGALTLALAAGFAGLLGRGSRKQVAVAMIALLPFALVAYERVMFMSTTDAIAQTTTFATRLSLAIWGMEVVAHNPLGVGFGGFLPSLTDYLPDAMEHAFRLSPLPMNFTEVRGYLASAQYAGTKTLILDLTVYLGLPFLTAFVWFVGRVYRSCLQARQITLLTAFAFVTIAICTYNGALVHYSGFLVMGVAWRICRMFRHKLNESARG